MTDSQRQPIRFGGVYSAMWSPTDEHGRIMESVVAGYLEFLNRSGVRGILALGSTGDFARMSPALRRSTLELIVPKLASLRLMVNVSALEIPVIYELARHAEGHGAEAVTIRPPWFYPLRDDDVVEFYAKASEGLRVPLIVYNFPGLTGKKITPELLDKIACRIPVGGLKQSGGDFPEHVEMIEVAQRHGFDVMTGWDTRFGEALRLGVSGCIGGLTNAFPETLVQIAKAYAAGDSVALARAALRMQQAGQWASQMDFPTNIGVAMMARSFEVGVDKTPLSAASCEARTRMVAGLKALVDQWEAEG